MLLVPVGIINERHEPPVVQRRRAAVRRHRHRADHVVRRRRWRPRRGSATASAIAPMLMAPLDALEFTRRRRHSRRAAERRRGERPERRLHGARLSTSASAVSPLARASGPARSASTAARLDYHGASAGGRRALPARTVRAAAPSSRRSASTTPAPLNEAMQRLTGVSPNIAEHDARLLRRSRRTACWDRGAPRDLVAFVRYENFDTQFRMPDGFLPLKQFDRDAWVVGVTYYPDPDIAVKVDYVCDPQPEQRRARSEQRQHRPGVVVLMATTFDSLRARSSAAALAGHARRPAGSRRQDRHAYRRDQRRALRVLRRPQITVDAGEDVEFRIKSDDTIARLPHRRRRRERHHPEAGQGEATVIVRRPRRRARYTFECIDMCGAGHNFMRGAIIVRRGRRSLDAMT